MSITVRPASRSEVPAVAAVLAEAFAADPVLAEIRPARPGEQREAVLGTLFAALVRAVPEHARALDVAVDGDRVLGAAFWQAPRPHRGGTVAFLRKVPELLRVLGVGGAFRALRHLRRMDRARPDTPHWYLAEIGVAAAARGQGVGGLLLDQALRRVDELSAHAYLESSTPQNRRLYRRHGFGDGAPITGFRAAAPVSMWRPAVA
ncbi:GNAT family N-acetyltransferase [Curtobacterium sp. RHCJP20]|uniref:GNAT family N-acetyltransferase n=1 Tax=Curtobacterium subtropicum TaxID=3055138 RepID=A0ABT7TEY0_9MICO|nr:GNAT family N-acetyltransferase [Curtobacterium subtropicum]MDM7888127.1 GNAT family N-acetyltransferase [Curtobacterium subtropicum]